MEDDKDFFKFYEDSFEETKLSYQKIIEAFVAAGVLEKDTTLENVVKKCKEIDKAEVDATSGLVTESEIGLQGYFASFGYSEAKLADDELAKKLYKKYDISTEKMPSKAEDRLKDLYMVMGQKALGELINATNERVSEINGRLNEINKKLKEKGIEEDKKNLKDEKINLENERKAIIGARAFLGSLAAGPYFPRQTCFSASHLMGLGSIMQIGCSQGKTSVVAMTTYEQLMEGKKVFSTSSAPGLVPENYDEARAFYEKMGIAEDFCAISQNEKDHVDHIVLFHNGKKYEVRADGEVYEEVEEKNKDGKKEKKMIPMDKVTESFLEDLGIKLSKDPEKSYDFEESVKAMMATKGIIMGDTITLGKYQHLMPDKNDDGVMENSFLIVDEADAELYDTQPQEITGEVYSNEEAVKRWENRLSAASLMETFDITASKLEEAAERANIDLGFLVDAYQAKTEFAKEGTWEVKDGKVFVTNQNTSVMIPASQGLQEAILAMQSETRDPKVDPEREVIGETNIPELFSRFETASLMSGTMEDKGISEFATDDTKRLYNAAREEFLKRCGPGIASSAVGGVIEWKLVTPKTRKERGNAIVNLDGINYDEKTEEISTKKGFSLNGKNWNDFIKEKGGALEEKWKEEVNNETKRRSEKGQPVMVSVYGDRVPLGGTVYTAKHQIGEEHRYNEDKYMASTVGSDGKETGEIAQFDDFYGRGYTFKFFKRDGEGHLITKTEDGKTKPEKQKKGGHVLITALPQNSRNLEQFLFRVARGGADGSSSMIISPTDPKLIEYLESIDDPEEANKYFEGVMNGSINLDQIVCDIYPKETIKLFEDKLNEAETIQEYTQACEITEQDIINIQTRCGKTKGEEVCKKYKEEYARQQRKMMKLHRVAGMPSKEERAEYTRKISFNTVRQLILDEKLEEPSEIIGMLSPNITQEELQELIPENKELTDKLIILNKRINDYIASRSQKEQTEPDISTISEKSSRSPEQIFETAKQDTEYNEDEMVKALAEIRNRRINERNEKSVEDGQRVGNGDEGR